MTIAVSASENKRQLPNKWFSGAKYVILMIGDGMGGWHVDATRKYIDNGLLAMETLKYHGYMTTYMRNPYNDNGNGEYWDDPSESGNYDPSLCGKTPWEKIPVPEEVQSGATDSAAAAGAMFSGKKMTKYSLNAVAKDEGYPEDMPFSVKYLPTIIDHAEALGKATGLVSSVTFNHATPATGIVKTQYRKNYGEKARQIIFSEVDVIMGAGHPGFDDNGQPRTPDFYSWAVNKGSYYDNYDGNALFNQVVNEFKGRVYLEEIIDSKI
jgi:alkaline phosphatase